MSYRDQERHISLKSVIECALFYFWDFLEERICADTPKTIKELKVSEFVHLLSQLSNKAIADAEEHLSVGGDVGIRELKRGHSLQMLLMDGRDSELLKI